MDTIAHVTYRYEIYVQDECVCFWQLASPMGPLARGDFLNSRTFRGADWPGLGALTLRGELLQIRWIEHLVSIGNGARELVHHTMLDCVALPDTWEMRLTAATGGCMFHAED